MRGMTSTQTLTRIHINTSSVKLAHLKLSSLVCMPIVHTDKFYLICSEIKWTDEYPAELPALSLESFYNKHLVPEVKTTILKAVTGQDNFAKCTAEINVYFLQRKQNSSLVCQ